MQQGLTENLVTLEIDTVIVYMSCNLSKSCPKYFMKAFRSALILQMKQFMDDRKHFQV